MSPNTFQILIFISSVFALLINILVIYIYYKFKRLILVKDFHFKLVKLLCIAGGINSLGYILSIFDL
jgi:hypothetical protein